MWWLISDEGVKKIQETLECAIDHTDEDCAKSGCLCDLHGLLCFQYYSDALHALESGLHKTDAVPSDWKNDALEADEEAR